VLQNSERNKNNKLSETTKIR